MIRKITSVLAACAFALATVAPTAPAEARHRRGNDYNSGYDCNHDGRANSCRNDGRYGNGYGGYDCNNDGRHDSCRRYDRRRDDHDDNDAVAAGVIGLALGAVLGAAISNSNNNRQAPRYDDSGSAYDRDYGSSDDRGYQPCTRRERQWDRYAGRYVYVDVAC